MEFILQGFWLDQHGASDGTTQRTTFLATAVAGPGAPWFVVLTTFTFYSGFAVSDALLVGCFV